MPMSDYVRSIRAMVGTTLLEVPTVSILTFDERKRVLLVRQAEGDVWSTPGGMIEPCQTPSDAAVREMWEETGLVVELTHVIGVFGGDLCTSVYANGDRISWVSTVFGAQPIGGTLRGDGEETIEARYIDPVELKTLRRRAHVDVFVDAATRAKPGALFQAPTWKPPGDGSLRHGSATP